MVPESAVARAAVRPLRGRTALVLLAGVTLPSHAAAPFPGQLLITADHSASGTLVLTRPVTFPRDWIAVAGGFQPFTGYRGESFVGLRIAVKPTQTFLSAMRTPRGKVARQFGGTSDTLPAGRYRVDVVARRGVTVSIPLSTTARLRLHLTHSSKAYGGMVTMTEPTGPASQLASERVGHLPIAGSAFVLGELTSAGSSTAPGEVGFNELCVTDPGARCLGSTTYWGVAGPVPYASPQTGAGVYHQYAYFTIEQGVLPPRALDLYYHFAQSNPCTEASMIALVVPA
jgi:hypothetical protein